jgi:hypothetical protein
MLAGNNTAVYPVSRQRSGTWAIHESLQYEILLAMSYIPSAFSDSDSITSCLSSALHLGIFTSDSTTDLM